MKQFTIVTVAAAFVLGMIAQALVDADALNKKCPPLIVPQPVKAAPRLFV